MFNEKLTCSCVLCKRECNDKCSCFNCANNKPEQPEQGQVKQQRSQKRRKELNKLRVNTREITEKEFLTSQGKEIRQEWNKKQACLLFAIITFADKEPAEKEIHTTYNRIVTISNDYGHKKTLKQIQMKMKEFENMSV